MPALSVETLEAAGYRRYPPSFPRPGVVGLWCKTFHDDAGKRYQIAVTAYDHAEVGGPIRGLSFSPSVQLGLADGSVDAFNVEMLHDAQGVEEVEAFFERVWTRMGAKHYSLHEVPPEEDAGPRP